MFNTFNFMVINRCCILGGPYYPTLPYYIWDINTPNSTKYWTGLSCVSIYKPNVYLLPG